MNTRNIILLTILTVSLPKVSTLSAVFSTGLPAPYQQLQVTLRGISRDFSRMAGNQIDGQVSQAVIWDAQVGLLYLPPLPSGITKNSEITAFSADGRVAVGMVEYQEGKITRHSAFYWEIGRSLHFIGDAGSEPVIFPQDVNDDGTVVVGYTFYDLPHAFIYRDRVLSPLVEPAGALLSYAYSVSSDGQTIVGAVEMDKGASAVRWRNEIPQMLFNGEDFFSTTATVVSADGRLAAGYGSSPSTDLAVSWDEAGNLLTLPLLPGWEASEVLSLTSSGQWISGYVERYSSALQAPEYAAFLWEPSEGSTLLSIVLANRYGLDFSDRLGGSWRLEDAYVADDGSYFYGTAVNSRGDIRPYLIDLLDWRSALGPGYVSGDGIFYSNWLRDFAFTSTWPMIWTYYHKWLYVLGDADNLWVWDYLMNSWWWTSRNVYPWLYQYGDSSETRGWMVFFRGNEASPRYFFRPPEQWVIYP